MKGDQAIEQGDAVTEAVIEALIEQKKKLDKIQEKASIWKWVTILLACSYLLFLVSEQNMLEGFILDSLLNNTIHLTFLLLILMNYGILVTLKKKIDKRKDDYESLRAEVINRSEELWSNEQAWRSRHQLFEQLKQEHDINLYYES